MTNSNKFFSMGIELGDLALHSPLVQTLLLAAVIYVLTAVVIKAVTKTKDLDNQRFWRLTLRNLAIALFVIGTAIIWRAGLQSVLVALGAAAAGFLIGFKEQWQSMLAFWVRVVKRQYQLNDFIEVDGIRGRVIDITWLSTTLAEVGQSLDEFSYSGRVVHIPNVRMIMANLIVENLTGDYVPHAIEISLPKGAAGLQAEALLAQIAKAHLRPYTKHAHRHMQRIRDEVQIDTPDVEPRIRLHIGHEGLITLVLRIVVPFQQRAKIEQTIIREFLANVDADMWPKVYK